MHTYFFLPFATLRRNSFYGKQQTKGEATLVLLLRFYRSLALSVNSLEPSILGLWMVMVLKRSSYHFIWGCCPQILDQKCKAVMHLAHMKPFHSAENYSTWVLTVAKMDFHFTQWQLQSVCFLCLAFLRKRSSVRFQELDTFWETIIWMIHLCS